LYRSARIHRTPGVQIVDLNSQSFSILLPRVVLRAAAFLISLLFPLVIDFMQSYAYRRSRNVKIQRLWARHWKKSETWLRRS
jgi:hypothetical protein